jgi:hypothetical protein
MFKHDQKILVAQESQPACNSVILPTPFSETQFILNNAYAGVLLSIVAAFTTYIVMNQFLYAHEVLNSPISVKKTKEEMLIEEELRLDYYIYTQHIQGEKKRLDLINCVLNELLTKCSAEHKKYYQEMLSLGYFDKVYEIDLLRKLYCISPSSMSLVAKKYCEHERKIIELKHSRIEDIEYI